MIRFLVLSVLFTALTNEVKCTAITIQRIPNKIQEVNKRKEGGHPRSPGNVIEESNTYKLNTKPEEVDVAKENQEPDQRRINTNHRNDKNNLQLQTTTFTPNKEYEYEDMDSDIAQDKQNSYAALEAKEEVNLNKNIKNKRPVNEKKIIKVIKTNFDEPTNPYTNHNLENTDYQNSPDALTLRPPVILSDLLNKIGLKNPKAINSFSYSQTESTRICWFERVFAQYDSNEVLNHTWVEYEVVFETPSNTSENGSEVNFGTDNKDINVLDPYTNITQERPFKMYWKNQNTTIWVNETRRCGKANHLDKTYKEELDGSSKYLSIRLTNMVREDLVPKDGLKISREAREDKNNTDIVMNGNIDEDIIGTNIHNEDKTYQKQKNKNAGTKPNDTSKYVYSSTKHQRPQNTMRYRTTTEVLTIKPKEFLEKNTKLYSDNKYDTINQLEPELYDLKTPPAKTITNKLTGYDQNSPRAANKRNNYQTIDPEISEKLENNDMHNPLNQNLNKSDQSNENKQIKQRKYPSKTKYTTTNKVNTTEPFDVFEATTEYEYDSIEQPKFESPLIQMSLPEIIKTAGNKQNDNMNYSPKIMEKSQKYNNDKENSKQPQNKYSPRENFDYDVTPENKIVEDMTLPETSLTAEPLQSEKAECPPSFTNILINSKFLPHFCHVQVKNGDKLNIKGSFTATKKVMENIDGKEVEVDKPIFQLMENTNIKVFDDHYY